MRSREPVALSLSLLGAIVAVGVFLNAQPALADDGDEMCGKNGQLWVDDRETRYWQNIGGHCTARGTNGPSIGDERCGASCFTVKYVAKIDRWLNTNTSCHGASNDVHLENLHTGTQSGTPSGWGGLNNPAPGGM